MRKKIVNSTNGLIKARTEDKSNNFFLRMNNTTAKYCQYFANFA